jgi:ubiquinone/menaquinone biosynthesis C-methylase UbiE
MDTQTDRILDQFTRQASLFQASHRSAESAIQHAITVSGVMADDIVLDVACGPGVLACAFAKVARHVTGIDITPTMLEHARQLQASVGVTNVTWHAGDVYDMPCGDGAFSMVVCRYAFHHFERPGDVLQEMVRVCRPGGHIVVIDSAPDPDKAEAFNWIEILRDPSHTRALTADEMQALLLDAGLDIVRRHRYAWDITVESLVARSFPVEVDAETLLETFRSDLGVDRFGMDVREVDGVLRVTIPTLISVARKGEEV